MADKHIIPKQKVNAEKFLLPISILLAAVLLMVTSLISTVAQKRELVEIKTYLRDIKTNGLSTARVDPTPTAVKDLSASTNIDDDPIQGDKTKAKVAIVEFSDYNCGYCQSFHLDTYPQIKKNFIENNKAVFVYRDYDRGVGIDQALAAQCVKDEFGDAKYYEFHNGLFSSANSRTELDQIATKVGVNTDRFKKCLADKKFSEEIKKDTQDGVKAKVDGTPGFVIGKLDSNGQVVGELVPGAQSYQYFEGVINKYLN